MLISAESLWLKAPNVDGLKALASQRMLDSDMVDFIRTEIKQLKSPDDQVTVLLKLVSHIDDLKEQGAASLRSNIKESAEVIFDRLLKKSSTQMAQAGVKKPQAAQQQPQVMN
jgi:hypothetical protein